MKYRGIEPHGIPHGKNLKYRPLHTAVLKGIAVFFYSTEFYVYLPKLLSDINNLQDGALARKRVRFYFVGKRGFLLCSGLSWGGTIAAESSVVPSKQDKPFSYIIDRANVLLSEWQSFIGGYP